MGARRGEINREHLDSNRGAVGKRKEVAEGTGEGEGREYKGDAVCCTAAVFCEYVREVLRSDSDIPAFFNLVVLL